MTNTKNWISVLPVGKEMAIFNSKGVAICIFSLHEYSVVNGIFKAIIDLHTLGASKFLETGMSKIPLDSSSSIRVHSPIELHNVFGRGFSPKMVYTLPRNYKVEEYHKESLFDKARKHTIKG